MKGLYFWLLHRWCYVTFSLFFIFPFLSVFFHASCNLLFQCSVVRSNKTVISWLQSSTQLSPRSYDLKYLIKQHCCFSDLCWLCSMSRSCIFSSCSEALVSASCQRALPKTRGTTSLLCDFTRPFT